MFHRFWSWRFVISLFFFVIILMFNFIQKPLQNIKELSPEASQKVVDCFKTHGFNECLSDEISVRRQFLDQRCNYCKSFQLNSSQSLPSTSIIITFHNEAWSTLLRSVHSVLDRSPDYFIEEILLIDDNSDLGE